MYARIHIPSFSPNPYDLYLLFVTFLLSASGMAPIHEMEWAAPGRDSKNAPQL